MKRPLLLALAVSTTAHASEKVMHTEETNKQLVRRLYEDLLNERKLALVSSALAPDYVGPYGDVGPAAFTRILEVLFAAFPDLRYTVEDVVAEGDRVAIRWSWEGTHRGRFRSYAPTGKRVKNTGMAIYRVQNGKIVRSWMETDRLGFLIALDVIPAELAGPPRPVR